MSAIIHAMDSDFEEKVINSGLPVLVDFWAEWCGPCKMITPVLDDLSRELDGKIQIVKYNIDENTEYTAKYGVRGIPTLLLIKNGTVLGTKVGAASKSQLAAFINSYL